MGARYRRVGSGESPQNERPRTPVRCITYRRDRGTQPRPKRRPLTNDNEQ